MLTVACVLRSGGEYTPQHVHQLYAGVIDNLNKPFKFVCLSDMDIPGITTIPLKHDWPGWWAKFELYKLKGPVLYIDLDTVITGNLDEFTEGTPYRFLMLADFYHPCRYASGLMYWWKDVSRIYDEFVAIENKEALFVRKGPYEQKLLAIIYENQYKATPYSMQERFKGIYSYKVDVQGNELPQDSALVCFHGKPRPWEVLESWM